MGELGASSWREGQSFQAQGLRGGHPQKLALSPSMLGCVCPGFEPQEGHRTERSSESRGLAGAEPSACAP